MDSNELAIYRNRKVNPNQVKRKFPKWLTNDRKQAMIRLFLEYPDNCLQGHYLCPIKEHYNLVEHRDYTYAVRHDVAVKLKADNGDKIDTIMPVYAIDNSVKIDKYIDRQVLNLQADNISVTHKQLHDVLINNAIEVWREDSRIDSIQEWQRDRRELHKLNERSFPIRGRFNNISSVIFHESQPLYYLDSIGMNGLTMQPYAKVKLASSKMYLFIELGNSLMNVSKHRRRKILRYGKLPKEAELELIDTKIKQAVRAYLNY